MKYNCVSHKNILWGQIIGTSKSMAKSRQSSVKRSSSGVLKFTAKKPSLHEEPMTLPSTSTKETTHYKERLQQKEGESVLIEGDGKFKNEYLEVNYVMKENGVSMSHTEHCSC